MAIDSLQRASGPANPTRRAAIGLIAAGAAITVPAVAASCSMAPVSKSAVLSPAMVDAVDAHQRAYRVWMDHTDTVVEPAFAAAREACDLVPHRTTSHTFVSVCGEETRLTTFPSTVAMARKASGEFGDRDFGDDYVATVNELLKLADARAAEIEAIQQRFDIEALAEEDYRLAKLEREAMDHIALLPAKNNADLMAKADVLIKAEMWDIDEFRDAFLVDLRFLAGLGEAR